jgi:hypothetical protein
MSVSTACHCVSDSKATLTIPIQWHPVRTMNDHFGDISTMTIVFRDETPEKVFNHTDQVDFAVPRPYPR